MTELDDSVAPAELKSLVEAQQARISVAQVRRIWIPGILMNACAAWTAAAGGVAAQITWGWFLLMAAGLIGRFVYFGRRYRSGTVSDARMLTWLQWYQVGLGALQAAIVFPVFLQPPSDARYILTVLMMGNVAGVISPVAGRLRTYVIWALAFGGALVAAWLSTRTLTGAAIAGLLVFLFVVVGLYVRDQGLTIVQLVKLTASLRYERDRAQRASEAKTRFFAAASHDLRQPLTALSYNAATVSALAQRGDDAILAQVAHGIRRALDESRGLLDSLLEVSKLDAGAVEVVWETVDIHQLGSQLSEDFTPLAEERGLDFIFSRPTRPLAARTDRALIRRVLQNLIGNALKFTSHGKVELEVLAGTGNQWDRILIRVKDTGPGIPEDATARIFEEFFQVGNAERDRSRGLGLGLAIVKRLSDMLETEIRLTTQLGEGSTFEVSLPRSTEALIPDTVSVRIHPQTLALGGRKVLIIDDEREIRDSLTMFLQTMGMDVCALGSIDEARERIGAGFVPQVLLVDFRLRGSASGLDALRVLREDGVSAPAVLITGDTDPSRIAMAQESGVPLVHKPVDGTVLLRTLQSVLVRVDGRGEAAHR